MAVAQAAPLETIFNQLNKVANDLRGKKSNAELQGVLLSLKTCVSDLHILCKMSKTSKTTKIISIENMKMKLIP